MFFFDRFRVFVERALTYIRRSSLFHGLLVFQCFVEQKSRGRRFFDLTTTWRTQELRISDCDNEILLSLLQLFIISPVCCLHFNVNARVTVKSRDHHLNRENFCVFRFRSIFTLVHKNFAPLLLCHRWRRFCECLRRQNEFSSRQSFKCEFYELQTLFARLTAISLHISMSIQATHRYTQLVPLFCR